MRRTYRVVAAILAMATTVALAACADPSAGDDDPLDRPATEVRFYGSDGNMLNGVGDLLKENPEGLFGMKGTTPLSRLSQSFKNRLRGVDPALKDEAYSGETYDAVVISALAAQLAKSTDPKAIAAHINTVTVGGTPCDSPATCLPLAKAGTDIAYKGITLGLGGFTDAGEPSASTFGILRFGEHNHIDDSQTEFVPAGDATGATTAAQPGPGKATYEPLKIGSLLPHTGDLASAGPPMFAGALLAIQEVNAAGGVLNSPVQWVDGDDFTDGAKAKETVANLVKAKVSVIIGAGASSITMAVLPDVVAAGLVLFSPCNTAAELSTVDDQGLYFRTAPPDNLQAAALTDIVMRDGVRRLSIVAREDTYGRGLMDAVRESLVKAGLAPDAIDSIAYDADKPDFTTLGAKVREFEPDGVLVIGFDETADAFEAMFKAGITSRNR